MFSPTRAFVKNVHLRSGLQCLSKQGEVSNEADVRRRTMAKGSCVVTHPGNGEHNSSPKFSPFAMSAQCNSDLAYFQREYQRAPEGSEAKTKALQCYENALQQRIYVDACMDRVGEFLFGTTEKALSVMKAGRHAGEPIIDDWSRYRAMVDAYVKVCGPFSPYAIKHMRSIANMCNAGVAPEDLAKAATYACATLGKRPLQLKFS